MIFGSIRELIHFCEGQEEISKILIANNGIGATKAIRSIRRWCFEIFGDDRKVVMSLYLT